MTFYFDASAAVSVFLDEARTPVVTQLIAETKEAIVISDLTAGELSAAIAMAVRTKRQTSAEALEALADFDDWRASDVARTEVSPQDMIEALALVRRFELALLFPDALHLAICRRTGATLVTGDKRQADAAVALALPLVRV